MIMEMVMVKMAHVMLLLFHIPMRRSQNFSRAPLNNLKWVEQLESDAAMESDSIDTFSALQQTDDEVIQICFDLELSTHRQRKRLERQPVLFLATKLSGAEVQVHRLSDYYRVLFQQAKTKEVNSVLKNEAVRKCLSNDEVRRAYDSNTIIKARWVLTRKCNPPDEIKEAKHEAATDPETVPSKDGSQKPRHGLCSWASSTRAFPTAPSRPLLLCNL